MDSDKLVDGMKEKWCQETIVREVAKEVKEKNIRAIFTFDGHGVSGHENHKAVYNALKPYLSDQKSKQKEPKPSIVEK